MLKVVQAVDILIRLQIYILSFMMLFVIYIQLVRTGIKSFLQNRLFKLLILSTMFAIFAEAASWVFEGRPGQAARIMTIAFNVLLLSSNIIPLIIWILYVDLQIHNDMNRIKRIIKPYFVLFAANLALAVSAPLNSFYFYVDAGNFYHRGVLAPVAIALYFLLLINNVFILMKQWKRMKQMNQRNRIPLLLFAFPPLAGFLFQMVYYGTSFVWAGVSLSILMAYITIQNNAICTDYLTGLYNRRQLDYFLEVRINSLTKQQQFAGIMIDIDNFKKINDKYGHITGDRAIETTASILKLFFKHDEFIARYAGDEFVVLLDIREGESLEHKVNNLQRLVASHNKKSKDPFEINFSMGYAIYTAGSNQSPDEFLNQLDKLMYENKSLSKCR